MSLKSINPKSEERTMEFYNRCLNDHSKIVFNELMGERTGYDSPSIKYNSNLINAAISINNQALSFKREILDVEYKFKQTRKVPDPV